jgi:Protein of unknown function (DUF3631)
MDMWEPLVAIADAIGRETGDAARGAAALASGAHDADSAALGIALLADIRGLFDEKAVDKFSSKVLCETLATIEGRPWAEYGRMKKPLSQNQLAKELKPFSIVSHTIRLAGDSTPKGYTLSDFEDAFARYLPSAETADGPVSSHSNCHSATIQLGVSESGDFQNTTQDACGASKTAVSLTERTTVAVWRTKAAGRMPIQHFLARAKPKATALLSLTPIPTWRVFDDERGDAYRIFLPARHSVDPESA